MIAAQRDDVSFVVMLAGPGVSGEKILLNQSELIGRAMGGKEEDLDLNKRLQNVIFKSLRDSNGKDSSDSVEKAFDDYVKTLTKKEQENQLVAASRVSLSTFNDPWFRFFCFTILARLCEK